MCEQHIRTSMNYLATLLGDSWLSCRQSCICRWRKPRTAFQQQRLPVWWFCWRSRRWERKLVLHHCPDLKTKVLRPGVLWQNSGCRRRSVQQSIRSTANGLLPIGSVRSYTFCLPAWPCIIARRQNWRHVPFFFCKFEDSPFDFFTMYVHRVNYGKETVYFEAVVSPAQKKRCLSFGFWWIFLRQYPTCIFFPVMQQL